MIQVISNEQPLVISASYIAKTISEHLKNNERVLWLLTGGSGIPIAIEASKQLKGVDLSNLYVSMTDERYGEPGHPEENWQQLLDGGLSLPGANLYRPLIGKDIDETTKEFQTWIVDQLVQVDYTLAIFGLGTDGHTCGIKPNSPAVKSSELVTNFAGDDFQRITITFPVIKRVHDAVIQASGIDKKEIISDLITKEIPLEKQPAQILKTLPKATLYTDIKKEDLSL